MGARPSPVHAALQVGLGHISAGLRVLPMLLEALQVLLLDLRQAWQGAECVVGQ